MNLKLLLAFIRSICLFRFVANVSMNLFFHHEKFSRCLEVSLCTLSANLGESSMQCDKHVKLNGNYTPRCNLKDPRN